MFVTVDGIKVRYQTTGAGEDVLLLHGWGSSLDAFRALGGVIAAKYRVTALDFPGFGQSDLPPRAWSVGDYADFTKKVMDVLGLTNPIMIGHSFGGRVIMKLCGTGVCHPEKIIFLDAAGVRHKPGFRSRMKIAAFKTAKWFLSIPLWKKQCAGALEKARAHFGSADYNAAPPVLRQSLVMTVNEDLAPLLPSITASTLLIYGENDTATPVRDAKIIESKIPDSGLCIIKNAGHWAFVEKPGEVASIVRSFLSI